MDYKISIQRKVVFFMKKMIGLLFLLAGIIGFSQNYPSASKDSRGVLLMESQDWVRFFNNSGVENELCPLIGALIMEESYIKDGKKMTNTLAQNQQLRKELNSYLLEIGLDQVFMRKDRLDEFYYTVICRKLADKDFDLVGSKTFKAKMNSIFAENKVESAN